MNAYIGQYLSEAVQKIFSVADDEPVQWQKVATPYSGKISQRDHSRLRQLYKVGDYHRVPNKFDKQDQIELRRLKGISGVVLNLWGDQGRGLDLGFERVCSRMSDISLVVSSTLEEE